MKKLDANEEKIKGFALKYRVARAAKMALSGPGLWEHEWQILEPKHVHCMREPEPLVDAETPGQRLSEGTRVMSWIWTGADRSDGEASAGSMKGMIEGKHGSPLCTSCN